MKILTVYFSKTGHTKAIAEMIHKAVGGELGEIRTKRSYAPSYGMAVLQGGLEQLRKSLPELAEMPETAEYDVIFVGSPVWWFTLTPAVKFYIHSGFDTASRKISRKILQGMPGPSFISNKGIDNLSS